MDFEINRSEREPIRDPGSSSAACGSCSESLRPSHRLSLAWNRPGVRVHFWEVWRDRDATLRLFHKLTDTTVMKGKIARSGLLRS